MVQKNVTLKLWQTLIMMEYKGGKKMKTLVRLGIITLLIAVVFGFVLGITVLVTLLADISIILSCVVTVISVGLFITFITSDMITDFLNRHI